MGTVQPTEVLWTLGAIIGLVTLSFDIVAAFKDLYASRISRRDLLTDIAAINLWSLLGKAGILVGFLTVGIIAMFVPPPPPEYTPLRIASGTVLIATEIFLVWVVIRNRLARRRLWNAVVGRRKDDPPAQS